MALSSIANESRESIEPNSINEVTFTRTAKSTVSTPNLVDFEVRGYSNEFGGQKVEQIDVSVATQERTEGSEYFLDIDFTFDTTSSGAGSDFVVEYTVEDSNSTEVNNFFVKNGVYSASSPSSNLSFRASAELERISETFADEEDAEELTDFSDTSRRAPSDFQFISSSSPFSKHSGEPVPYFSGSGSLEFPNSAFSSRNSTAIIALQWNQERAKDFPVAQLKQGGNTYFEIRNAQNEVELHSDFATSVLYSSSTYRGEILIAECRVSDSEVFGSVNGEITSSPSGLTGSFSSGDTTLEVNSNNESIAPKIFDVIVYENATNSKELDRVAKQLGYFYKVDLAAQNVITKSSGSRPIEEHLFYNQKFEQYDMIWASGNVRRYDQSGSEIWNFKSTTAESVAVDSRQTVAVGSEDGDVYKLDRNGDSIWKFTGHSDVVNSVELSRESNIFSGSEDSTVKKLDLFGNTVWNFGHHSSAVNDLAVYEDQAVYTASDDETVRRLSFENGTETWSYNDHLSEVLFVSVDREEVVYSVASNGELRAIDNDGNQLYLVDSFDSDVSIEGMAISYNSIYLLGDDTIKKFDSSDGSLIWKNQIFESNDLKTAVLSSVAVSSNGSVFVGENSEDKILELDEEDGTKISEISVPNTTTQLAVQPGTFEPHWI